MADKYALRHRLEFGDPEPFGDSRVIACDASVGRAGDQPWLPVAGAVVDDQGHWWAWRAEVASRYAGRATAWAECWTLLTALQWCRPGATVLADHMGAISCAQFELRNGPGDHGRPHGGVRRERIESIFGPLPVVRRASAAVRHYGGELLFHRADAMSRAVREGGSTSRIVRRCEECARV